MKTMNIELPPPDDPAITTLWIGHIDDELNEQDLQDVFYAYGKVVNIHMARPSRCAFVEYSLRSEAEHAASQLYNALMVKGRALTLSWAKPRAQAVIQGSESVGPNGTSADATLLPPPGMESAPLEHYALPGLQAPLQNAVYLHPPPGSQVVQQLQNVYTSDAGAVAGGVGGGGGGGGGSGGAVARANATEATEEHDIWHKRQKMDTTSDQSNSAVAIAPGFSHGPPHLVGTVASGFEGALFRPPPGPPPGHPPGYLPGYAPGHPPGHPGLPPPPGPYGLPLPLQIPARPGAPGLPRGGRSATSGAGSAPGPSLYPSMDPSRLGAKY